MQSTKTSLESLTLRSNRMIEFRKTIPWTSFFRTARTPVTGEIAPIRLAPTLSKTDSRAFSSFAKSISVEEALDSSVMISKLDGQNPATSFLALARLARTALISLDESSNRSAEHWRVSGSRAELAVLPKSFRSRSIDRRLR